MYFECKEKDTYPFPGSAAQQSAFCMELFSYIDGLVVKYRKRLNKESQVAANSRK